MAESQAEKCSEKYQLTWVSKANGRTVGHKMGRVFGTLREAQEFVETYKDQFETYKLEPL